MTTDTREITFELNITPEAYLRYYQGAVRDVITRGHDGRTVQFPAGLLRRFLTHDGIRGEFRLRFDARHKLVSLDRIERER
jgi:hypothetical protein